jgi:hypothetical protein
METRLLYTVASSETKAVLLFTPQCQARCTAQAFEFLSVSQHNVYNHEEYKGYKFQLNQLAIIRPNDKE